MLRVLTVEDIWDEQLIALAMYKTVESFEGQKDIPVEIIRSFLKHLMSLEATPSIYVDVVRHWWLDLKEEAQEELYLKKGESVNAHH